MFARCESLARGASECRSSASSCDPHLACGFQVFVRCCENSLGSKIWSVRFSLGLQACQRNHLLKHHLQTFMHVHMYGFLTCLVHLKIDVYVYVYMYMHASWPSPSPGLRQDRARVVARSAAFDKPRLRCAGLAEWSDDSLSRSIGSLGAGQGTLATHQSF